MRARSFSPWVPRTWRKLWSAVPTPYQPVMKCRFWAQANTQGIARRSFSELAPKRRAGREPILSSEISSSGLAAWK